MQSGGCRDHLFAQRLCLELKLPTTDREQLSRDTLCFMRFAEDHLICGHLGDPESAAEDCYAKAREIAKSPTVEQRNRAKVMVAWLKKRLRAQGHEWKEGIGKILRNV